MNPDTPTRARLPVATLAALAPLRAHPGVQALHQGEVVWLRWEGPLPELVLLALALPGATLYEKRGDLWFPATSLLPTADVPDDRQAGWKYLAAVLFPAKIGPSEGALSFAAVPLRLVPGEVPQPATALVASRAVVLAWSDGVPAGELAHYRAARKGDEILLVGDSVPSLMPTRRYHGRRVRLPLGMMLEPALPEAALVELLRLPAGAFALMDLAGSAIVSEASLTTLSRASLRGLDRGES